MRKIYIQNKHFFKNKTQMVMYILLFLLITYLFILIGETDFKHIETDAEKVSAMFSEVPTDNVFKLTNASNVRMILNGNDGIILFGTNNDWVNYYAKIVDEAAKENNIDTIYFYDFIKNRSENNGTYESIVLRLNDYVLLNDRGVAEIYAPTLIVVKKGKVLFYDCETSFVKTNATPAKYWNDYKSTEKKLQLNEAFSSYKVGDING